MKSYAGWGNLYTPEPVCQIVEFSFEEVDELLNTKDVVTSAHILGERVYDILKENYKKTQKEVRLERKQREV